MPKELVEGLVSIDPPEEKPAQMWTPMSNPDDNTRPPTPEEKAAYLKGLNDATMALNAGILLGKDLKYVRNSVARIASEMVAAPNAV